MAEELKILFRAYVPNEKYVYNSKTKDKPSILQFDNFDELFGVLQRDFTGRKKLFPGQEKIDKKLVKIEVEKDQIEKEEEVKKLIGAVGINCFWNNESFDYMKKKILFINEIQKNMAQKMVDFTKIEFIKINILEITQSELDKLSLPKYKENFEQSFDLFKKDFIDQITENVRADLFKPPIDTYKFEEHRSIRCNKCGERSFIGRRYFCSFCTNGYNLCENCEKLRHEEKFHDLTHSMIKINKAIEDNSIIDSKVIYNPDKIAIKSGDRSIKFRIFNDSKHDICGYILPVIKYKRKEDGGIEHIDIKKDVIICKKKEVPTIAKESDINFEVNISAPTKWDKKSVVVCYFRMFSKEGIPFGNVLEVTLSP